MKRNLFIVVFAILLFFPFMNAKATNIDRGSVILDESVYGKYFDSLDNASETMKNNYNTAFNNLNYNEKTEDYVCGNIGLVSQNDVICYKWDKNVTFSHPPQIAFTNWYETGSSDALMYFVAWSNASFNIKSCYNSNSCSTKSQQYIGALTTTPILNKQSISNKVVQGKQNIFYYKGSIDIIFGNYTRFNYDYFSTLIIKDEDKIQHTFNYGDTLLRSNGDLNIKPIIPNIEIDTLEKGYVDETKEKLLFHKIGVKFDYYDLSKYIYEWKTEYDSEWNNISEILYDDENGFEFTSKYNQTFYVQVKNFDNEVLNSATYTFSNIEEQLPNVKFKIRDNDSCNLSYDNENYITCRDVQVTITNYDLTKYQAYYKSENEEWQPVFSEKYYEIFYDNLTYEVKVVNKKTNEEIVIRKLIIAGITMPTEQLGQYIAFDGKFYKDFVESYYQVTMLFYNYDDTAYNYFYSDDNGLTFEQIFTLESVSPLIRKKVENFYEDKTLIIKVEDKNGKLINTFVYEVEYMKSLLEISDNSFFDVVNSSFNKFIGGIGNVFNLITIFFNGLPSILQSFYMLCFFLILAYLFVKFLL